MTNPHFQLYIDGSFCEGAVGAVMHSQNPADGKTWASFACTDKQDVERAVVAAKRALDNPEWRDMMQTARGKLLSKNMRARPKPTPINIPNASQTDPASVRLMY